MLIVFMQIQMFQYLFGERSMYLTKEVMLNVLQN